MFGAARKKKKKKLEVGKTQESVGHFTLEDKTRFRREGLNHVTINRS